MSTWKFFLFLILSIMLFNCTSCSFSKSVLDSELFLDKEADEMISDYIISNNIGGQSPSDQKFEAHYIHDIIERNGLINVHMYSLFEGFSYINNTYKESFKVSNHVIILLKKENNKYTVVGYAVPREAAKHDYIRKIVPPLYTRKPLNEEEINQILTNRIMEKVDHWLMHQEEDIKKVSF